MAKHGMIYITHASTHAIGGPIIHDGSSVISVGGGFALTFASTSTQNLILTGNGRISTGTAAGSTCNIDATTSAYGQGLELRYAVTDWADTYTLTEGTGMYLRMENQEANASASLYGAQIYGVSNNVANTQYLWGALVYAYVKGAAGLTCSGIYGIQPEITFDAATASSTITDAAIVRAKLTGGTMSDYTVLDGYRLTLGDMNGGSRRYGNGLLLEDDSGMSGTCTLTTGININIGCTTGLNINGLVSGQVIDYTTVTSVGETTEGTEGAHLIRYGKSAAPIVYAPSTGGSHSAIQMYLTAEDVPTGLSLAGIRTHVTYTGSGGSKATAYGGLFWVKLNCTSAGYTGDYLGGTPAGVQGVIEVPSGAVALSANEHQWLAGVAGEVRPLGTITKTGVISGLRAVINANTDNFTAGVLAGVHVGAYLGTVHTGVLVLPHVGSTFTTGLHLDSQYGTITTGISIGACSGANLRITGASGTGFNIANILIAADSAGTALAYGSNAASVCTERVNATAQITGGNYWMGKYASYATSGSYGSTGFIMGTYDKITVGHLVQEVYAQRGRVSITASLSGDTGNQYIGSIGYVDVAGSLTLALADTGGIYGVLGHVDVGAGTSIDQPVQGGYFDTSGIKANLAGETSCVKLRAGGGSDSYTDYGLNVEVESNNIVSAMYIATKTSCVCPIGLHFNATSGSITSALTFTGASTYFADFNASSGANGTITSDSGSAATSWKARIKVKTDDGTDGWMNVYSTSNES